MKTLQHSAPSDNHVEIDPTPQTPNSTNYPMLLYQLPNAGYAIAHKLPNGITMPKRTSAPNRKQATMNGHFVSFQDASEQPVLIHVNAQPDEFRAWLTSVKSFSYSRYANPAGDEWIVTVRRERRGKGSFWYAYKTHEKKTYKVYIGKDEAVTPKKLVAAVDAIKAKISESR